MNYNKALLLLTVQAASLLATTPTVHAVAECDTLCGDTATTDLSIQYDGRCKQDEFLAEITDSTLHACIICIYNAVNSDSQLTTIGEVVDKLCLDGYSSDVFPFSEISRKGAQFDNEHYSGGGEWNYEIETSAGEDRLAVDAARVDDIYHYEAQRKVIEFPDKSIESLNPYNSANSINDIQDLDGCDLNAAYCCFAQDRQAGDNNGNCATPYEYNCVDKDPADNTNICYIDHNRSSKASHVNSGVSIFGDFVKDKENIEGSVHCHGFAWGEDPLHTDNVYKGNLLFFVSMYDHLTQRGYARNIPGSPMCACAENMAVVTRADCTQVAADETTTFQWSAATQTLEAVIKINDLDFNACTGVDTNNDLEDRVVRLNADGHVSDQKLGAVQEVLVGSEAGNCHAAIESFLGLNYNITVNPYILGDEIGNNGSPSAVFPLGRCEGDCDNDGECDDGLKCFQRDGVKPVPGCLGEGQSNTDYCYLP